MAVAALIFVGPKDLPILMRRVGQMVGKGQVMAREFRAAFDDIARQTELDEMKKEIEALRQDNMLRATADEFSQVERDINAAVMRGEPINTDTQEHATKPKLPKPNKNDTPKDADT